MLIAQKTHMTAVLLETRVIDLPAVEQSYRATLEGERVNHEQSVERLRGVHRYALEATVPMVGWASRWDPRPASLLP
jgi:hypothetical protein